MLNSKIEFGLTSEIVYRPSKSVVTPLSVPLTITFTPGNGPWASETVPDMLWEYVKLQSINNPRNNKFLTIFCFINNFSVQLNLVYMVFR